MNDQQHQNEAACGGSALTAELERAFEKLHGMNWTDAALSVRACWTDAWLTAAAAEREACAKVCEEVVTQPPGYGGQWEGYGPVTTTRDGKACAAEIRARSNASN